MSDEELNELVEWDPEAQDVEPLPIPEDADPLWIPDNDPNMPGYEPDLPPFDPNIWLPGADETPAEDGMPSEILDVLQELEPGDQDSWTSMEEPIN